MAEHERLVALCQARDAAALSEALSNHIARGREALLMQIDASSGARDGRTEA